MALTYVEYKLEVIYKMDVPMFLCFRKQVLLLNVIIITKKAKMSHEWHFCVDRENFGEFHALFHQILRDKMKLF